MGERHRFVAITSAVLLTVGLLGAAVPSVAGAAEQPAVTLTSTSQTASWSGEFVAGAGFSLGGFAVGPTASLPDSCTPQFCDIVPVEVRLAEKTWQQRPGGLLVSIEARIESFDSLDLYVYGPDRALAASSVSVLSDEAAWIENPVNGTYTVVVVPASVASQPVVDGVFEPLEYRGFVEFARGVTVEREELNKGKPYTRQFVAFGLTEQRPAVELLPDLVPTTPRDFHIETTVGKGPDAGADRGLRHPPSCYPDEMLGLNEDEPNPGDGPLRCLRFDQGQHNVGDGPMELHVYEGSTDVYQRIYSSDGGVRQIGPLGQVHFSQSHGHFHYVGFQANTLHRIEDDGSLTYVKDGIDKGICMPTPTSTTPSAEPIARPPHLPMKSSKTARATAAPARPTRARTRTTRHSPAASSSRWASRSAGR